MCLRKMGLTLVFCLSAWAVRAADEPTLTEPEFKRLHKLLLSSDARPYDAIPWLTSVQEARKLAAKEKKPILSWAQNGHPLGGC